MKVALVLLGLALPILCGYLLIDSLNRRFGWHWHRALRLALGVLTGYGLIYIVLLSSAGLPQNLLQWLLPAGFGLTAAGLWLWQRSLAAYQWHSWQTPSMQRQSGWTKLITGALALWIVLICVGGWIEGLSRPVYPWDAWLAWTYRAKAWFYEGGIGALAAPSAWLAGKQAEPYTIDAFNYPDFSSVLQYWTALLAGEWSEYRVSLAAIPVTIASLGAVYGLARDGGSSRLQAMTIGYAMVSLPLLRTHLSLPGYADIWVMAYAGVGLAVLMSGIARGYRSLTIAGLLLLTIGTQIKHEGMIWLYLGLALLAIELLSIRLLTVLLTLLLGFCGGLWLLGGVVDLPILGRLGIADGQLWLPGLPTQTLAWYDSWPHYQRNFLQLESWHLLWPATTLLAALAIRHSFERRVRIALLTLALMIIANVLIFFVSAQGAYASTYTALNRLPLQLLPAVMLSLLWLWQSFAESKRVLRGTAFSAATAMMLVFAGFVVFTPDLDAPSERKLTEWRAMMGLARTTNEGGQEAVSYQNGIALLSSGPLTVDSSEFQTLRYEIAGSGEPAAFFWRRADRPADIVVRDLNVFPKGQLQLKADRDWYGQITELGFLLYEAGAQRQTLSNAALYTPTRGQWLADQVKSWMTAPRLDQRSINFSSAGATVRESYPVALATIAMVLAAMVALVARVSTAHTMLLAVIPLWLLLDLRWTALTSTEKLAAMNRLAQANIDESLSDADAWAAQISAGIQQQIADDSARIAIVHAPDGPQFEALRVKYRLLPTAAVTLASAEPLSRAKDIDYVLTLGEYSGALPADAQIIWSRDDARLYRLAQRR